MPETGATAGGQLTPGETETLWRLADQLIPATRDMPAASSAAGCQAWLSYVVTARPDLVPALRRAVGLASADGPAAAAAYLRDDNPAVFLSLATAVAGSYYLNPAIRRLIGYPGQEPTLLSPEDGLGDGILGPVRESAARYRRTPSEEE